MKKKWDKIENLNVLLLLTVKCIYAKTAQSGLQFNSHFPDDNEWLVLKIQQMIFIRHTLDMHS